MFPFLQLITQTQQKLHLQFNINYIPFKKLPLLPRKGQTLEFRSLSGIDFVQINYDGSQQFPHSLPETMRKLYISTKFPHQENR